MGSFLTQGVYPRQIEEIRDFEEISMKFCRDFDFSTFDENFDQSKSPFLIVSGPCLRPGLNQFRDCLRPVFRSVGDKPSTPEGFREACLGLDRVLDVCAALDDLHAH